MRGDALPQGPEIIITPLARFRLRFLALAGATIVAGLLLQAIRSGLPMAAADILGDALWGLMIYWLVGAALPETGRLRRMVIALLTCWAVEFSQLYHAAWLDAWRTTTLGRLVLGSGFDSRDLAAYGLGVLLGFRLEDVIGPPCSDTPHQGSLPNAS